MRHFEFLGEKAILNSDFQKETDNQQALTDVIISLGSLIDLTELFLSRRRITAQRLSRETFGTCNCPSTNSFFKSSYHLIKYSDIQTFMNFEKTNIYV